MERRCRHGISRDTFYTYQCRYEDEGIEGLEPRSRRPYLSPRQIDLDLEVEICRMRKDHPRWGARRIRAELDRAGIPSPGVSTIHQALRRNHLVADQPRKRPKFTKRFEREVPNDLWQIDGTACDGDPVDSLSVRELISPKESRLRTHLHVLPTDRRSATRGLRPRRRSGAAAYSCVEEYSPATLVQRSFAFDGTVASIELRSDSHLPPGDNQVHWVTFAVNRWFRGGPASQVSVWPSPVPRLGRRRAGARFDEAHLGKVKCCKPSVRRRRG